MGLASDWLDASSCDVKPDCHRLVFHPGLARCDVTRLHPFVRLQFASSNLGHDDLGRVNHFYLDCRRRTFGKPGDVHSWQRFLSPSFAMVRTPGGCQTFAAKHYFDLGVVLPSVDAGVGALAGQRFDSMVKVRLASLHSPRLVATRDEEICKPDRRNHEAIAEFRSPDKTLGEFDTFR